MKERLWLTSCHHRCERRHSWERNRCSIPVHQLTSCIDAQDEKSTSLTDDRRQSGRHPLEVSAHEIRRSLQSNKDC